jgi:DNA-binding transcriptional regulator YdaS (Cro superfamily)
MQFKTYFKNLPIDEREAFATCVKSTKGHLQNVAYGYRPCSPALAVAIEFETKGEVTRVEMLPNDWQQIWPELVAAYDITPATTQQQEGVA